MFSLLIGLIVFGLIFYLINNLLPLDAKFRQIINVVLVIICVLWLLSFLGVVSFPIR